MANAAIQDNKKIFKLIFLTVFLDIAGFAIIFPLIPQLTQYYTDLDPHNFFLKMLWDTVGFLASLLGAPSNQGQQVVLFGCLLGSLYSALQFFAAPFWGKLSDRYGRKSILRWTLFGTVISYVLWILSGSFTVLVIARLVGGLCSGNISVASAVIADITDVKKRSSGMAYIGVAFALGFVFGPALGGLLSQINFLDYFPQWESFGVNPFSAPALLALILALFNFITLIMWLPETANYKKDREEIHRSANILKLFSPHSSQAINLTNTCYFLFITLFAGMEFTLTFLTVERLAFEPLHNGFIFVYIGLLIALVQGGFVRRRANIIGEKKVAMYGLIFIIPGLICLAYTQSLTLLLIGLFFLAAGAAMCIPTLTSMISLFASENEQGHVLGIFRSLGALGRIIGPLWASLIFWRWGSHVSYLLGAITLIIPIWILSKIPYKKSVN
jgi:MFS family permease